MYIIILPYKNIFYGPIFFFSIFVFFFPLKIMFSFIRNGKKKISSNWKAVSYVTLIMQIVLLWNMNGIYLKQTYFNNLFFSRNIFFFHFLMTISYQCSLFMLIYSSKSKEYCIKLSVRNSTVPQQAGTSHFVLEDVENTKRT